MAVVARRVHDTIRRCGSSEGVQIAIRTFGDALEFIPSAF